MNARVIQMIPPDRMAFYRQLQEARRLDKPAAALYEFIEADAIRAGIESGNGAPEFHQLPTERQDKYRAAVMLAKAMHNPASEDAELLSYVAGDAIAHAKGTSFADYGGGIKGAARRLHDSLDWRTGYVAARLAAVGLNPERKGEMRRLLAQDREVRG